jgi:4'-phosphopantetheinyl transferase
LKKDFQICGKDVEIWQVNVGAMGLHLEKLKDILNPEERKRAERYHFQKDRDEFVAGRGALRILLGRYCGREPREIPLSLSNEGKPLLPSEYHSSDLRFNLSHSRGIVLIALTRGREVGVDVERMRADYPAEKIAGRFFSSGEKTTLEKFPPDLKEEAFFTYWTAKEAFLKARGEGLLLPLDRFELLWTPGETEIRLVKAEGMEDLSAWRLMRLPDPAPGYVATLAVEGREGEIRHHDGTEILPSSR